MTSTPTHHTNHICLHVSVKTGSRRAARWHTHIHTHARTHTHALTHTHTHTHTHHFHPCTGNMSWSSRGSRLSHPGREMRTTDGLRHLSVKPRRKPNRVHHHTEQIKQHLFILKLSYNSWSGQPARAWRHRPARLHSGAVMVNFTP